MEKKLFDSPKGIHLDPPPLIYMHEHFKAHNIKCSTPLENNWVWYSLEDLKSIVAEVEKLNDEALKKEGDGVRLYYGIYNKKVCEYLTRVVNNGENYLNHLDHNSVFFVPTYKIEGEGEHIDNITPETAKEFRDNYCHDLDLPDKLVEGGYNLGHICPPPKTEGGNCNGTGSVL